MMKYLIITLSLVLSACSALPLTICEEMGEDSQECMDDRKRRIERDMMRFRNDRSMRTSPSINSASSR